MALRIIRSLPLSSKPFPHLVLCVGNFDGVHRGHRKIIDGVVREAQKRGGTAAALTFDPHPGQILRADGGPALLTTQEQKLALLEEVGLQVICLLPFTRALSQLTAHQFAETVLVKDLSACHLYVGPNFHFGHGQQGDTALLKQLGQELGFAVHVVAPVQVGGQPISSTVIRQRIVAGDITQAARLLGRPYALTGSLEQGAGRGSELGFPTLNFQPEQTCLPARGVYITETVLPQKTYPSVTNIGIRPTFAGQELLVESHLLDTHPQITRGTRLTVHVLRRLREEKPFSSIAALQSQITKDVEAARRFFVKRLSLSKKKTPNPQSSLLVHN